MSHTQVAGGQVILARLAALEFAPVIEHSVGLPLPIGVFISAQRA